MAGARPAAVVAPGEAAAERAWPLESPESLAVQLQPGKLGQPMTLVKLMMTWTRSW